jgi:hypothetical protein
MNNIQKILLAGFSILALYGTGLGLRRFVLDVQREAVASDLSFTLESALHYRRVKMVYDTGHLPAVDPFVQYPQGVRTWKAYTAGSEYVYAALARLFPRDMPMAARLRWIESGWFCTGIGFMFLWLLWWRRSWSAAWAAGLFYAVSLSAVIRSTGQELSRENFALPLLIAHLAFHARARSAHPGGERSRWDVLSAAALALAVASWDLMQVYVLLWALVAARRALSISGGGAGDAWGSGWLVHLAALVAAGVTVPYLRSHGFLVCPAMGLAYGAAALEAWSRRRASDAPPLRRGPGLALLLAPLAVCLLWGLTGAYGESYSHFASLLWAKARFLNAKPADPSLLTFDQRIMWVPALHGANWRLTRDLAPAMLPLSLVAAIFAFRAQPQSGIRSLLFFCGSSLLLYCLFARFHVFLAVFAAGLLGVWAGEAARRGSWQRWLTVVLLGLGCVIEAGNVVLGAEKWGRPNVYYKELSELAKWLEENVSPEPVLANFGVSGYIAAYGKCPILLHPKFESAEARARVREYAELLFKGSERSLRDWAAARGAKVLVYSKGEFASVAPELQMRYMVEALEPDTAAPARILEFQPEKARYFRLLWSNRKYAAFRVLSPAEEQDAAELAKRAEEFLARGELRGAESNALESVKLDSRQEQALRVLLHVDSLRRQGFDAGRQGGR